MSDKLIIVVETIPHAEQRYNTVGDYSSQTSALSKSLIAQFKISQLGDWRKEVLVLIHEIVEWSLCKNERISEEEITDFDIQYENRRAAGETGLYDETGDHPGAPYYKQHQFATGIERTVAAALGVDWNEYEDVIAKACNSYEEEKRGRG